ncbi:uncharacterized protein LOC127262416 [Andrographis paniculata]|uniref:uncharacterized protein LOC127262416 n=1 Tax=Andrographis paniculata TaxID=175694 RepID=UPI0021E8926B|nr:uncharacterized protein LOC127262416 [Andrographis paniculata]
MRALIAKGKEGFITGEISKPNDATSAIVWRKTDNMILQWILNSITSQLTDVFGYVSTNYELWELLKERYGQCNGPLIYRLQREISGLSQGGLSLATYFTKLKKLKNELRSQILMMDPLSSLNKVYGILSSVEKQQEIHGHNKDTCFKLNRTPDWYKAIQERRKREMKGAYTVTDQQAAMQVADGSGSSVSNPLLSTDSLAELIHREIQKAFMKAKTPLDHLNMLEVEHVGKEFVNLYTDFDDKCLWILDSGATCHVSNNLSLFKHLKLLNKPAKIHLPNGTTQLATHTGSIQPNQSITLYDVYYIPDFKYCLISIHKMCLDSDLCVNFVANSCSIQDQTSRCEIGKGRLKGHLYYLWLNPSLKVMAADEEVSWHFRLGHPSNKVLQQLSKPVSPNAPCDACHYAKQKKLSFNKSTSYADSCFELIHVDIWGPYSQASLNGSRYFLTIVDDHSISTWTYLMKLKS